jgi:serine/threonine protein kinase
VTPQRGQRIGGKYRLDRAIAEGGMGSVWMADHEGLGSRIAVKFIAPLLADDATARVRFEREAKMAAKLQSPHVVQVIDYGIEGECPYIAMEYLAGENLEHHLARGALSIARAAEIIEQIAKAIGLAHAAGIVHRDLKPSNIFLAEVGGETIVKVCDFGIAKQIAGAHIGDETTTGTVLGSPHALSPEQARGGAIDHRSDLWSLGVIAFRMITAQRPFDGANLGDVIVRICTDPIPRASACGAFSADVDRFFDRAFERDPARRFQSARELANAFSALARDPSATIARPSEPAIAGRDAPTALLVVAAATSPIATSPPRSRRRFGTAVLLAVAVAGIAFALVVSGRDEAADAPAASAHVPAAVARPVPHPPPTDPASTGVVRAPDPTSNDAAPETAKAEPAKAEPVKRATAKREPVKRDVKRAPPASGSAFDPFSGLPLKP